MHPPSLRQLRFLVALADKLHFSRAAETCNVTQSTLSTGLKELEANLGVKVADRTNRSVLMTPAGLALADRARVILAQTQDLVDVAQQHRGVLRGPVRLGTIPTVGPFLIPRMLPRLRIEHPDLKLYLREELTDSLLDGLRSGRLDVVLIALPFETGDLHIETLFTDGYQLATAAAHRLTSHATIKGPDLNEETLLLLERGHCLQRHALSAFPESHASQDESFAATSLSTLIAMVEEGLGTTLLPQLVIDAGATRNSDIQLIPLEGAWPRTVVLAWRKNSSRSEDFAKLAGFMRRERAQLTPPR